MKIKVLTVLGLATLIGLAGCKSATNTNTAVVMNTNTTTTTAPMSTPMSAPTTAAKDTAAETTVKAALDKAGLKDVTVDATAAEVTLRGTVAKGKLGEAVRIATETGKRKINNQLTEK